jgi:membrane-associated protease RseP (regulator of RpoE activity)
MSRGFDIHEHGLPDELADAPAIERRPRPRRVLLPVLLFVATCYTTYKVQGSAFSAAVMFTLLAHELGHFIQAIRYRVPASLPYFIPMPASPIGTMGAVIVMQPGVGDRRSIFDIGISGPLAGLLPALVFSIVGLQWSEVIVVNERLAGTQLGEPLLFKAISYLIFGPLRENQDILLHPLAFAGWVGVFITALNLVPIGQLDGGHVLYCLLLKRAHGVAQLLLFGAMAGMVIFGYWQWIIMIFLLMLMGPIHPPTANDEIPLGPGRTILGWASLLFLPLGFTPVPFM